MISQTTSGFGNAFNALEETCISLCLGAMTLITFANVIARYVFNSNILWALEATVFLFAWLVLMGCSYGVKHRLHIGVDIVIDRLPPLGRKISGLFAVSAWLAFSLLLLIGAWNYWYPFATTRVWLETDDIPMPEMLMFLADWMNDGERFEKIPRFIPYLALPLGIALLTFRFLQASLQILRGDVGRVIASHEVEDQISQALNERADTHQAVRGKQ